jgi:hypothetical protein
MAKCPNDKQYGERVCRGGYLWELTYSEMAPPDQRQNTGIPCPSCSSGLTSSTSSTDRS